MSKERLLFYPLSIQVEIPNLIIDEVYALGNNKNYTSKKLFLFYWLHLLVSALLSVVLLVGCSNQNTSAVYEDEGAGSDLREYGVFTVKKKSVKRDITALGNLEVFKKATVSAPVDGIVEKVYVKKGDYVNRGDRLFFISNYNLEIEYAKSEKALIEAEEGLTTAQIQYEEEKKNLYKRFIQLDKKKLEIKGLEDEIKFMSESINKKNELYKKGGITAEAYNNLLFSLKAKKNQLAVMNKEYELSLFGFRDEDITGAGLKVPKDDEDRKALLIYINTGLLRKRVEFAKITLKKAELDKERVSWLMDKRWIESPISGFITDIGKFQGEKVSNGDVFTTVVDLSRLIARVSFSEKDLFFLNKNSKVKVFLDAAGRVVQGSIYSIDPYVDKETRTVDVSCLIKNDISDGEALLLPGMFVKVIIPVSKVESYLIIPDGSVIRGVKGSSFVFTVSRDGRVYRR